MLGLRSVMTTALDSDERLHSEVGLKQERESITDLDDPPAMSDSSVVDQIMTEIDEWH